LDADVVAMREVYRDLGYLDAVVELERLEFSDDRAWVTIHIAVEEGPPYVVESLDFKAIKILEDDQSPLGFREEPGELVVDEKTMREKLTLKPGDVFRQRAVEEDHRILRDLYGERGHVEHPSLPAWEGFRFLDPELLYRAHEPKVRVVYRLVQGAPITVREILVRGNVHTQDR